VSEAFAAGPQKVIAAEKFPGADFVCIATEMYGGGKEKPEYLLN
jgi:hypothetical protein